MLLKLFLHFIFPLPPFGHLPPEGEGILIKDIVMKINFLGFHLIEILITLAIISILTALGVPAYTQHLVKERRLEAENMLSKLAIAMEEYQIEHDGYQDVTLELLHFPEMIVKNFYRLNIQSLTENHYLLAAIPQEKQAEQDASCAVLTLNSKGEKGNSGPREVDECW